MNQFSNLFSRRQFMRLVMKSMALLAFLQTGVLFWFVRKSRAATSLPEGYNPKDHKWCMSIDVRKCIGCGRCAAACKMENHVPPEPYYFRTWVERYEVHGTDEPIITSPNGGIDGFPPQNSSEEFEKSFYVPKLCNHCETSPCTQVCPTGATFVSPDGVVMIDYDYCIGCRFCIQACPFGCRFFNPETQTADKCNLCYHRITQGLLPACVEVCPVGARQFGDLKDPESKIHAFLAENQVDVLKPQLRTHPKVYYAGLDKAVK